MWRQLRSTVTQTIFVVMSIALGIGVVTTVILLLNINQRTEQKYVQSLDVRELTLQETEYDVRVFYSDVGEPRATVKLGPANDDPLQLSIQDLEVAKQAAPTIKYAYLNRPEVLQSSQIQDEEGNPCVGSYL